MKMMLMLMLMLNLKSDDITKDGDASEDEKEDD